LVNSVRDSNFNKSVTDTGDEEQIQNIESMLPVMLMPLQPSLVITEEPTLIQETLSLHDHKKIEVKQRMKSVDEDYMGSVDIYNTNEVIYSQTNQRYKVA
jgi:hypothetical protein